MLGGAAFLGAWRTREGYPVVAGCFQKFAVVDVAGGGSAVEGELFAVGEDDLRRLDEVEGVLPGSEEGRFVRRAVEVCRIEDGSARATAWVYMNVFDGVARAPDYGMKYARRSGPGLDLGDEDGSGSGGFGDCDDEEGSRGKAGAKGDGMEGRSLHGGTIYVRALRGSG